MKVTLLPSCVSPSSAEQQFLTSYLINDTLAVDAGALGLYGTPREQARVRHVLISHTHFDHLASLPMFVENVYQGTRDCVTVHGSPAVLEVVRRDVFSDRLWADFLALGPPEAPFLKLQTLEPGRTVELEGLRITPVPVNHVLPNLGLVIDDGTASVVIPSDTGPTEEIWEYANNTPNLKAVFLEASFPNEFEELARTAKHLTPALFAAEVRKLKREVRLFAVHIKPRFRDQIVGELKALGLPNLEIARPDRPYVF